MKKVLFAIVVIAAVVGFSWLNSDISSKKAQPDMAGAVSKDIVMMSDDDPRIDVWSKNFPEHADMYQAVETEAPFETEFGETTLILSLSAIHNLLFFGLAIHLA